MANIEKEVIAYEHLREMLEADHMGEWVVVHDEELVGTYETFTIAADDAAQKFGNGPYLIRQVGAEPTRLSSTIMYGV